MALAGAEGDGRVSADAESEARSITPSSPPPSRLPFYSHPVALCALFFVEVKKTRKRKKNVGRIS